MTAPDQDHHKVLGVPYSATTQEIKKAFRKLAKEYHPDKKGSAEKFKAIRTAFEELTKNVKLSGPSLSPQEDIRQEGRYSSDVVDLAGFERRVKAEGCKLCYGLGYATINPSPAMGFMALEEKSCSCQRIGIE